MNGVVRPFRPESVYGAPCMACGTEIESPTPDVPFLCPACRRKENMKK